MNLLRKKIVNSDNLEINNYVSRMEPGFINGSTHAWRRTTFDLFGSLAEDVGAEDTVIPFRSVLLGQICYIHEPLVLYRRDANRLRNKQGFYDFRKYREFWLFQKTMSLAIYRNRLKDLEYCDQKKISKKTLVVAKDATLKRIEDLENFLEVTRESSKIEQTRIIVRKLRNTSLRRVINLIISTVIPIAVWLNFLKLITYMEFQNYFGSLRDYMFRNATRLYYKNEVDILK
jgi:hypothetical protein